MTEIGSQSVIATRETGASPGLRKIRAGWPHGFCRCRNRSARNRTKGDEMSKTRRYLFAAAGLAAIATAFPVVAAERGGTLTMARPDEPLTLRSVHSVGQRLDLRHRADLRAADLGRRARHRAGAGPGRILGGVATTGSPTPSSSATGVKFSDGTPLTVEDAIFSLGKVSDPAAAYGFAFADVASDRARPRTAGSRSR